MKELFCTNIINNQTRTLSKELKICPNNNNSFRNQIKTDILHNIYFKELKESQEMQLNIINSKISIIETQYEKNIIYSQIKEIIKKYEKYPPISINILANKSIIPLPLFDTNNNSFIDIKSLTNSYPQILSNYNINDNKLLKQQKNLSNNNKLTNINNITFLNQKRKTPFINKKKTLRYKIFFTTTKKEKSNDENINSEINSETSNINPKNVIFLMDKKLKNMKGIKIKKNPGRKKKNSGEIGIHNKFSKDNMMRKLKNKVMESARRLINKMIKIESGENYKEFGEMRKIQGIFCQELNIKFNFWFYSQPLKSIFQFKMSTKYSKGDFDSNFNLISKIYSEQYNNKFPKTIKLLEMMFHQYFHEIFLGEKNWTNEFDITEEDNKFEINYFLQKKNNEDENDFYYLEKMNKLAKKYETFFLDKNPRINIIKSEEKISQTREMIKNISQQDYERYKYYFISKSVFYIPDIKSSYLKYLNKYKDIYQDNLDFFGNTKIKSSDTDNFSENNSEFNKKLNDDKRIIEIKYSNKIEDNSNSNENNLFNVEKIEFLKIDKNIKKIVNSEKKINFFINRKEKEINNKRMNSPKNNNNKEKYNKKTNLFIINRENYQKSKY